MLIKLAVVSNDFLFGYLCVITGFHLNNFITKYKKIRYSSSFVHVLLISIQLQTDTKTIPILFIKYRNWYKLSIRLLTSTKNEFYQIMKLCNSVMLFTLFTFWVSMVSKSYLPSLTKTLHSSVLSEHMCGGLVKAWTCRKMFYRENGKINMSMIY